MKDITGVVSRQGNVDTSNATVAKIDADGLGVVMSILSNMYTNAPLAVLREYVCNARDSHIASGQTRPVEVTLPSNLQPTLLIQDYGLGLSRDEIADVFGTYGKSTKRESNDQVGAFGIGSKSAFTMGHQFVVTGVKDGQKTVALFALNEDNIGTCTIIKEQPTDEPNGVLISLAVEDVDTMRETAAAFFAYWERGTVLVDGHEPTPLFEGAVSVNDQTFIQKDHEGHVIVVMGQVPYTVGRDILRKAARDLVDQPAGELAQALVDWYSDSSLLFKVEIGDCDIAPTREGLRDTKRTLATLTDLLAGVARDLTASVQVQVDKARNPFEARMLLERALDDLGPFKVRRKDITFAGGKLKKEVETPFTFYYLGKKSYRSNAMVVRNEDKFTVDHIRAPKTVVVTGVPENDKGKVTRYVKRFLENYTTVLDDEEGTQQSYEYVIPVEEATGEHDWFVWGVEGGVHTMTLDEYKASLRAMRDSNPRTKTEPSYTTGWARAERDLDERDLLTDIISWGKDIVIYGESALYADALTRKALDDYTVVVLLPTQSQDALIKRVVEDGSVEVLGDEYSDEVRDLVKTYARKVFESVTDDEKAALGAIQWLDNQERYNWQRFERSFSVEEITSKTYHEVMDAFALAELVAEDISEDRKRVLALVTRHIGKEIDIPAFEMEIPNPADVWPLLWQVIEHNGYALRRNEAAKAQALALLNAA
jgi:hypothetical protein